MGFFQRLFGQAEDKTKADAAEVPEAPPEFPFELRAHERGGMRPVVYRTKRARAKV